MPEAEYYKVEILNVSLSNYGFVIFLKHDDDERVLPICIGAAEANSISAELSKQKFPRPLSHTLFKNILTELGYSIPKIHITELKDGTYYARVFLKSEAGVIEFDSRPSDAIALALRFRAPIMVHQKVFNGSAVLVPELKEGPEEEIEKASITKSCEKEDNSAMGKLKKKLETAVAQEKYEEAARLKEKIQQLEMEDLLGN